MKVLRGVFLVLLLSRADCLKSGDACKDKSGGDGACMLIKECTAAAEMLNNQQLPFTCGYEKGVPIICCPNDDTDSLLPKFMSEGEDSEAKCNEYAEKTKDMISRLDFVPSIVGGINATLGEYPHMAALGFWDAEARQVRWQCGGTLISESFILTAAHCLTHSSYGPVRHVRLGEIDLTDETSTNRQDFQVSFSISHPDYAPPSKYHDIALVEMDREATFNEFVKPACLHRTPNLTPYRTNSLHVSGWGTTEFGGRTSDILQYVILDLFSQQECNQLYKRGRALPDGIKYEHQLCAGSRKNISQDACQGDSGGPIQVNNFAKRLYNVVGVTSFGQACGAIGVPGVYTRVSNYVKWIEGIVWPKDVFSWSGKGK